MRRALSLAAALALLLCATASAAPTYVSLEFDDGTADQLQAAGLLEAHGMRGTFFPNSARVGKAGRLSWSELQALQARGHEIAGHTKTHAHLTALDDAAARSEICGDRTALLAHGLAADHFAYPFGERNAAVEALVADCEYLSGRLASGLVSGAACNGCPFAVKLPVAAPFAVRIPDSVRETTTLAQIQTYVTQAEEHGGGWVRILMHHVCDGCNLYAISPKNLDALLTWLAGRTSSTRVRTPSQVMDPAGPTVAVSTSRSGTTTRITAVPAAAAGVRRVRFLADGKQLGTRTAAPWRWNWATSAVAAGPHTVQVLLEDARGNAAASPPVGVAL
jgi:peptidoglycan/xylan/chitin deacetylase (PgdA/CDA1 family)